jgi:hypothetical protein
MNRAAAWRKEFRSSMGENPEAVGFLAASAANSLDPGGYT